MRCVACNAVLTDFEATRKSANTGEYIDLCNKCFNTIREEVAVIEKFLPAQMSAEDLRKNLEQIISEVGATSAADMGKVMGAATKKLGGQADGKSISAM